MRVQGPRYTRPSARGVRHPGHTRSPLEPAVADDDDLEDDAPAGPGRRYLTRAGAERMHVELLRLLNDERPRVTAEVSAAAAQGDRSENAEYIYGKKKLREIDRRIHFLPRRLDTSRLRPAGGRPHRSRLVRRHGHHRGRGRKEIRYQIVGPTRSTPGGRW